MFSKLLLFVFALFFIQNIQAQYITNGNASAINCHCYQLTDSINAQAGSVWNTNRINLNNSFDFSFDVFFGCKDVNGADGIVFILQPISTSVGSSGGGLGYQGITPSIGVMMDTYQNGADNDPFYDHISINRNGVIGHSSSNNLAGPIQIISGNDNAEDCNWHIARIVWDATTFTLTAFIDGVQRVQIINDIVNTTFAGNSLVYWGFSASTGGLNNNQKFCTRLNSQINNSITSNATCIGNAVNFTGVVDAFIPVINYHWDFGDGTTANVQNPLPHTYALPGVYTVKFAITGADGCVSDTAIQSITIGAKPTATFAVNDTCSGNPILLNATTTVSGPGTINTYNWFIDNVPVPSSNAANVTVPNIAIGTHTIKLVVSTDIGCVSDTIYDSFTIYPTPSMPSITTNNVCEGMQTIITSSATDATLNYGWLINGTAYPNLNALSLNLPAGAYTIKHFLSNTDGCVSDTATAIANVYAIPTANFTVNDTCLGKPITMTSAASGTGITHEWYVNNVPVATTQSYTSSTYTIGTYNVMHIAKNNGLCADTTYDSFIVLDKPQISATAPTVCFGQPTVFTATLNNPPMNITTWQWLFPDGSTSLAQSPTKTFGISGVLTAKLIATNNIGCVSDTLPTNFVINKPIANAGADTLVFKNQPFTLNGTGSTGTYNWQPSLPLSNAAILNPTGTLAADQLFTLTITTPENCIATDAVSIKVFDGSRVYVPTAFTPNKDGINDVLQPLYIGINKLQYFKVYNRWGKLLFTTNELAQGWDGNYNAQPQPTGTYVWLLTALDYFGKIINQKGTVTIIK